MRTVWQLLLDRLANGGPIEADEARRLDKKQWQGAIGLGLLREIEMVESIICDQCGEGHWAGIHWVKPGVEAVFGCTEGVFEIEMDRLRQWRVDAVRVAGLTAGSLDLPAAIEVLLEDCLWRIGRRRLGGRYRDIFFGIGGDVAVPAMSAAIRSSIGPGSALLLTIGAKVNPEGLPAGQYLFDLASVSRVEDERVVIDLDYVEERLAESSGTSGKSVQSIPAPAGTSWNQVSIIVFEDFMQVTVSGKVREVEFTGLGVDAHSQSIGLLKLFAAARGTLDRATIQNLAPGDAARRMRVQRLRQLLRECVEVDGEPIQNHRQAKVYACQFEVRLAGDDGFRLPAGVTWLDLSFHERADGRILITIPDKQQFRARGALNQHGEITEEVAEQRGTVTRTHTMEEMGLRTEAGQLMAEGAVFIDMLRAGGTLRRGANDIVALQLAVQLRDWTGLDGEPLRLVETSRSWTAVFACSSELRMPNGAGSVARSRTCPGESPVGR